MLFLACRNPANHFLQFIPLGGLQHRADAIERVHSLPMASISRQRDVACIFNAFDPHEYVSLHNQNGFQQVINFVFSHVVFLLLVGGVATTTLAGGGVAFYSREVAP